MTLRTEFGLFVRQSRAEAAPRSLPGWRRAVPWYIAVMVVADFFVTALVATAFSLGPYGPGTALGIGLLAAAGFVLATAMCHGYRRAHVVIGARELRSMLPVAGLLGVASLVLEGLGWLDLPHRLILNAILVTFALVTLTRILQRRVTRHLRAEGRLARRTLLVGPLTSLESVFDVLDDTRTLGMTVVGICSPEHTDGAASRAILGTYSAVPDIVAEQDVDAVVVSADAMDAAELRRLGWRLRHLPVELLVLPPLSDVVPRRLHLSPLADTPLLAVSLAEPRGQRLAKALVDRTVGTILLLGALPVIAAAAVAVRVSSPGPAFFSQQRVGLEGRLFTMYKMRTMYVDAESRLAELQAHNDGNGMLFKMHQDPRVTRVGRTLRRLSIDELPQLWNVVKGDMSLVGPRPALPREVAAYSGDVAQRLAVKPGLTGLWQVSGRSNLSVERSVRLDLRYADNWSVGMDIRILLRTATAVVRGDGAY